MRTRRTTLTAAALAGAALAAALTGCTAATGAATSTPTSVSTADWPTAQVFHVGPATETLVLPAGAKSLRVEFSCTYGLFAVAPAMGIDSRSGMCGGAESFDFDVSAIATGTRLSVGIAVPDDTRFTATLRYSPARFEPDARTKKQCAILATVVEAYTNADEGYDHGEVTDAQWTQQTQKAKADLDSLAQDATADASTFGLLGPVIPKVSGWLTGDGDHPGGFVHAPAGDFGAANSLAGQICSANGTPMVIHAKYGG